MTTDEFLSLLETAWRPAREMGALGGVSVAQLRDHAAGFVPSAFRVNSPADCVDIGSGVGVPGIFLAHLLPHTRWILVDASQRRCEVAHQAVEAVGLGGRVAVVHGRVDEFAHLSERRQKFDLVVSRLFGHVSETAECGLPLVRVGGCLVVSCREPAVAAWSGSELGPLGGLFGASWTSDQGTFVRIDGVAGLEGRFPRRPSARRRAPYLVV